MIIDKDDKMTSHHNHHDNDKIMVIIARDHNIPVYDTKKQVHLATCFFEM